uniref:Pentatricopeptide repeat-containing protein n=1 Tax=Kalanchoe fedtschenkoi TaxID=63787 RepID=A0A7N0ZS66_KALFE
MDCKTLSAYTKPSLHHFNGGFPAKSIKPDTRKASSMIITNTLSAPHLQPSPNRSLRVEEKPVRKHRIRKTITPGKKKVSKAEPTSVADVLRLMDALRLRIGVDVYSELVEECAEAGDSVGAAALLEHIRKSRFMPPVSLLNQLLLMSVKCGLFEVAWKLFDEMPVRNLSSYAIIIAASFDKGEYEEALDVFVALIGLNFFTEEAEFPLWIVDCALKACLHTMNFELGVQVHCWLIKQGYASDSCLGSSLISFYGNFSCLEEADSIFDHLDCRDTVAWTAQIVSKCREGNFDDAINVFKHMGLEGVKMNHFTYSSILRACGSASGSAWCGKQVHARVVKLGFVANFFVQCGLVDMYGKRGSLSEARRVFEMIRDEKNVPCWNSMISGYVQHGLHVEAMKLLYEMKGAGLEPQESLLRAVQVACGSTLTE